jgi:quercetin dioxygenase-like cupin family protein
MQKFSRCAAIAVLLGVATLLGATAFAGEQSTFMLSSEEMRWEPYGLTVQRVRLVGDPNKPNCPSVTLTKWAAGSRVPEHATPRDVTNTVLKGNLYVGIGDKWDDAKLKKMGPGSVWSIPAGVSNFKKNDEEVIYLGTVTGPLTEDCLSKKK